MYVCMLGNSSVHIGSRYVTLASLGTLAEFSGLAGLGLRGNVCIRMLDLTVKGLFRITK